MTIGEIAELVGVSPTTVSFVLNNRAGVSPERRAEITRLLLDNGYTLKSTPSSKATAAPTNLIRFVKLRSRYQNDDYACCVLDAVEKSAKENGFDLSLLNINGDSAADFASLSNSSADGMIFLASSFTENLLEYTSNITIPCVYIDFGFIHHSINTVNADTDNGMYLVVKHLHELGHKKIGYIRSKQQIGCLRQRFECFNQYLYEFCHTTEPFCVLDLDMTAPAPEEQLYQEFSKLSELPTAFVTDNDTIASACLYAIQKLGLDVPKDISIVGFDNALISSLIIPRLTTVDINFDELGHIAVERLKSLIENPHRSAIHINVDINLIKRESTGAAKVQ